MGITYKVDKDLNLLYASYSGVISNDDMQIYATALAQDTSIQSNLLIIDDLRSVTDALVTRNGFDQFIHTVQDNERLTGAKGAMVCNDQLSFGLARMGATLSDAFDSPIDWQAFRDVDAALAWLGIEDDISHLFS